MSDEESIHKETHVLLVKAFRLLISQEVLVISEALNDELEALAKHD